MANFAVTGQQAAITTSPKTSLRITGGTGGRTKLYDLLVGASGTPADNALVWTLIRHTANPTDTAVTPTPLDPADVASRATAGENATVEGTVTAGSELLEFPINQRGTMRWVASPGGELIIPATLNNGICVRTKSATYTGAAETTIHFNE